MRGCRLLKSVQDPDCGCIEEEWDTPAGFVSFHLLPTWVADVFFDNGDEGEWETKISGIDEKDFRLNLETYIRNFG